MNKFLEKVWKDPVGSKLIAQIIIVYTPILITIIPAFIDYYKGVDKKTWIYIVFFLSQLAVIWGMFAIVVSSFSKSFFRETFSLYAILTQITLLSLFGSCFVSKIMPWDVITNIDNFPNLSFHIAKDAQIYNRDYVFFFVTSFFLIVIFRRTFVSWNGLVSERQHQEIETKSIASLYKDATYRVLLFFKNEPIIKHKSIEIEKKSLINNHDIVSLAWKDLAKNLILLKSSSYKFIESDWHDAKKVWIGKNHNSKNIVALIPINEQKNQLYFDVSIEYIKSVALKREEVLEEIIFCIKESYTVNYETESTFAVSIYTENELLDQIVNYTDYIQNIINRVTNDKLVESDLHISDVYVSPRIVINEIPHKDTDLESYLGNWLEEPGRKHLALLGDYGQGKSTASLMFCYKVLEDIVHSDRIPILIELRGRNLKDQEPVDILGQWGGRYGISGKALLYLHEAGKLIIIFEGFDEMSQLSDYETRRKYFKALWAFSAYPKAKIIITGRPNLFESSEELAAALGITDVDTINTNLSNARCIPIKLLPFNESQIESALRNHKPYVKEQINERIKIDSQFLEIISRPSLLHIVSILWEQNNLQNKVLNSANIIGLFVYNSYTRQAQKEKFPFEFTGLNTNERAYFMSGVATFMVAKEINSITLGQLNDITLKLLEAIPENLSSTNAISQEPDKPLKDRLTDEADSTYNKLKLEQLFTDVRTSSLLIVDPANSNGFKFGHKSFMEFLFADVIFNYIQSDDNKAKSILFATSSSVSNISKQKTSAVFLAELLSNTINSTTKRPTHSTDSLATIKAERLFNSLLQTNGFKSKILKIGISIFSVMRSLSTNPPKYFNTIFFCLFTMSCIFSLYAFLISDLPILPNKKILTDAVSAANQGDLIPVILILFLLMISFIIYFPFLLFGTSVYPLRGKIRLWIMTCFYSNINDKELYEFLGLSSLKWMADKPFCYFYNSEEYGRYTDELRKKGISISTFALTLMTFKISSSKLIENKDSLSDHSSEDKKDTLLMAHVEHNVANLINIKAVK